MSNLNQKKIVLGVCGSIAAYKSAVIIRHLIKAEADVKVILTASASQFITPLTLSTLSKNEVITDLTTDGNSWNNHVELGLWADAFVIAPASANTIGKMANGICDNMLLATYFSAKCPVFFAPAMDLDMWKHKAVKRNIELLHSYGNILVPVEHGELASGLVGDGRMAEPEHIMQHLEDYFS